MKQKRETRVGRQQNKRGYAHSADGEDKPDYLTPDKQKFLDIREHLAYFEKESIEWYKRHDD
jgi:hypothetical protein